jgi:hypothetical protein
MSVLLHVEPGSAVETGRCECCGQVSRKVSGTVSTSDAAVAAYFVHWTIGHIGEQGAHFDLIVGRWGDGTAASDRIVVRLEHRIGPNGPGVVVINASLAGFDRLAAQALTRDAVMATRAADIFGLYDAIIVQDPRLAPLLGAPDR